MPARFILLALALSASSAHAHLELIRPPSRYGGDILKYGPCGMGDGPRTENVVVLEPGATLELVWDEYIDHPGHYYVAFDDDGQDDFVEPRCLEGCDTRQPVMEFWFDDTVLLDEIPDQRGGRYTVEVTLPNIECDNCTLQVVQVMYDKPPQESGNDLYYQCVDLILRGDVQPEPDAGVVDGDAGGPAVEDAGPPAPVSDADAPAPENDAGSPTPTPERDAATPDEPDPETDSGTVMAADDDAEDSGCQSTPAPAPLALLLLALAVRRRRH